MSNEVTKQPALTAVFQGTGQPIAMRRVPLPELQAGEVLVQIEACGVCGSDVRTYDGRRGGPTPCVLGHEVVGRVAELAGSVYDASGSPLDLNDRVVWSVVASCGRCDRCRAGLDQKCRAMFKFGHQELVGRVQLSGGMSEFCHLPVGSRIVRVPEDLPASVATQATCATATVAAAIRLAEPLADRRVVIFGAGALGLTAAAMASIQGAARVTVCDPDASRHHLARLMGATDVIGEPDRDAVFDVAMEMSGAPNASEAAITSLDIGGVALLVGSVSPSEPIRIDPERVVRRMLRIEGLHNYAPKDLAAGVDFLTEYHGRFPFAEFAEQEFALAEAENALQYASRARPLRVLIRP